MCLEIAKNIAEKKRQMFLESVERRAYVKYAKNSEVCCKVFGCGNKLSITEQLFGDVCIKHSAKEESPNTCTKNFV